MYCSRTYEVSKHEQHKAAQRDQSYRNCLIALLIFFFLCLVLILACIPWKIQNLKNYDDAYSNEPQYRNGHPKETTTKATKSVTKTYVTIDRKGTEQSHTLERLYINKTEYKATTSPTTRKSGEDYTTIKESTLVSTQTFDEPTEGSEDANTHGNVNLTSTLKHVTNKTVGYDATSSNGLSVTTIAPTYKIINTEIAKSAETEMVTEEETATDMYFSESENSKFNVTIGDSKTLTSSTLSVDLAVNQTKSSVIPEVSTKSSGNFSDEYRTVTLQSVATISSIAPTLPARSYTEENIKRLEKTDGYSNSEESSTKYETALKDGEYVTKSSSAVENHTTHLNNEFSTSVEAINKIKSTTNLPASTQNKTTELYNGSKTFTSAATETTTFTSTVATMQDETTELYNGSKTYTSAATESTFASTTATMQNETTELYNGSKTYTSAATETTTFASTAAVTATTVSFNDRIIMSEIMTTPLSEDIQICETGRCRQIVSKMLSYMNHSADPCDDFYEYACGGFQANPQMLDGEQVQIASNYQRIAKQMSKEKHENMHSAFTTYYDSCVRYSQTVNYRQRIKIANHALRDAGQFYINDTWFDHYANFTELFAHLISHHNALLFDVVPEFDEYNPDKFTLKIGPWMYTSPFWAEHAEDSCSEDEFETRKQNVDLEILYNNYKDCKKNTRNLMRSIREALIALDVFKSTDDSRLEEDVISEYVERTVYVINSVIMEGYFSEFPSKNEIEEVYLTNNYEKMSLEQLQGNSEFINWAQLLHLLKVDETEIGAINDEHLQVYFHDALTKGLRRLEKFAHEDSLSLNNAIMALYAHKLYNKFVLPSRDNARDHCLEMTAYLLPLEASSLYISSFSDREIERMNRMTQNLFDKLKRTLKLKMEAVEWAKKGGREELLKKINGLKLALPDVSYFKNRGSLYSSYNTPQVILSDNYFNNSLTLLRRYRASMYAELRGKVDDPKRIWTYYTTPFKSKAQVIYCWNLVVIPYGVIDWSSIKDDGFFDFILLAKLGNIIAHQIAHHFDTNGIHYWNKTRNTQDTMLYEDNFTDMNFDDYINCHKESLYQGPMNMLLPFTDQVVSFTIPRLTLNERLSDIVGLRLAYDTLAFTRSDAEKQLPWIKLRIEQLFYLAYAQMHCTKLPLTSSYVSLYESKDLPSRIRVFVSASNNKLVAEAWNCPIGSQIAPNDVCSIFPYIDFKEPMLTPE